VKKKPDIKDFIEGGAAAATEQTAQPTPTPLADEKRITKTIRIRQDVESRLKDEAYQRSKAKGKRVTESDVIEEALIKYLNTLVSG
jgi:hypothetical protein